MPKTKVGEEASQQSNVARAAGSGVSLAFRVSPMGDGLYAAEMLLIVGDTVKETRIGVATTLGHAIGGADNLMDGWAFSEIEQTPEEYFRAVFI